MKFKILFFLRCDKYRIPWVTRQRPYQLLLHLIPFYSALTHQASVMRAAPHEAIRSRHTLIHTLSLQTVPVQLLRDRFVHLAFLLWQNGNSWRLGSLSSAVTLPAVYPKAVSPLGAEREHSSLHRGDYFIP